MEADYKQLWQDQQRNAADIAAKLHKAQERITGLETALKTLDNYNAAQQEIIVLLRARLAFYEGGDAE